MTSGDVWTPQTREMLREKGLCGKMLPHGAACIRGKGHDGGAHEQGWTVTRRIDEDPYAKDSRESITTYVISDGVRAFETDDATNATWLAVVLNAAENPSGS